MSDFVPEMSLRFFSADNARAGLSGARMAEGRRIGLPALFRALRRQVNANPVLFLGLTTGVAAALFIVCDCSLQAMLAMLNGAPACGCAL